MGRNRAAAIEQQQSTLPRTYSDTRMSNPFHSSQPYGEESDSGVVPLGLLGVSSLIGLALLMQTWTVAGSCYITPCEEGAGLAMLFTVDPSRSFDAASTALLIIMHGWFGCWLFIRCFPLSDQHQGLLLGSSVLLLVVAVQSVVRWGQQTLLMSQLAHHGLFLEGRGSHVTKASPATTRESHVTIAEEPAFQKMACLAGVEAGLLLILMLYLWRRSFSCGASGSAAGTGNRPAWSGIGTYERKGLMAAENEDDLL